MSTTQHEDDDGFESVRDGYLARQARMARQKLERAWGRIQEVPNEILLRYDSKTLPKKTELVHVVVEIGDTTHEFDSDPESAFWQTHGKDHRKAAEAFALWKWHSMRGTPLSEDGSRLVTEPDFRPPTMVWAQ